MGNPLNPRRFRPGPEAATRGPELLHAFSCLLNISPYILDSRRSDQHDAFNADSFRREVPTLMVLWTLAALPFLGALAACAAAMRSRLAGTLIALAATAAALGLLLSQAPAVLDGGVVIVRQPWLPAFGLDLALRLDGLSLLFAVLVLAIGLLVLLYTHSYLPEGEPFGYFLALMLAFMGSMLAIVLAENLLLMVIAWEMTSFTSFLLIGFHRRDPEARRAALTALAITGSGGLALLGGVLLLGRVVDSFALGDVLTSGDAIAAAPLALPILLLLAFAAFSKSAQLPFHFWLPAAMAAPTPVSAYLHSAALVKAGIYLLARFWPVLSPLELWTPLLGAVGLATMLTGAWYALFQSDMKGLLAYSTVSHLGMLVLLLGLGTETALLAALLHLVMHALFKAALFMTAGIVEHATGTRDLDRLGGLRRRLPLVSFAALLATAAMAGLPPLGGYVSKEMMLDAVALWADHVIWPWPLLVTLAALLSAAYAYGLAWRAFLAPPPEPLGELRRPSIAFIAPVLLLALLSLAAGLAPQQLAQPMVDAAASSVLPHALAPHELALWHGPTLAFKLGLVALGGGLLMAALTPGLRHLPALAPDARTTFERGLDLFVAGCRHLIQRLHNGALGRYASVLLATVLVLTVTAGADIERLQGDLAIERVVAIAPVGWAVTLAASAGVLWRHERRLISLMLVSVIGLVVVLAYVHLSAPDLALTQITVEIVSTVLLLMAIRMLPPPDRERRDWPLRRLRDGAVAASVGIGLGLLAFAVMTRSREAVVAHDVLHEATQEHGRNLVHLVLVDFRGFDTLGEISVVMIAALGVFTAVRSFMDWLGDARPKRHMVHPERTWDPHPLQLQLAARLLLPLALLVAAYFFATGSSSPGGGFVAGLIAATAFILLYVAHGVGWTEQRIGLPYRVVVAGGLFLALATGGIGVLMGDSFLTHQAVHGELPLLGTIELSTALLFDFGVFMAVTGATLLALINFGRLETDLPEGD